MSTGAGLILGALLLYAHQEAYSNQPKLWSVATEESIAVLPFESLSESKADTYFADGIQDEILCNLVKVSHLKIVSRTSVMRFRPGDKRNLRSIAQSLGVANVVEMPSSFLDVCVNTVNSIKSRLAKDHETTYQAILGRLRAGTLIHADETKVAIEGFDRYVWVFANFEEVAFVYGDTREAKTAQAVLGDFRGVLVSDFYTAYDGFDCAHQKCLIHLMRKQDLTGPFLLSR